GGLSEFVLNSPASGVFIKEDSKFREAFTRGMRYLGAIDPYEGHDPETLQSVVDGVASIASGWSNYQKAKAIIETGRILDKKGNMLVENASFMDGVMKAFGFSTYEEASYYAASKSVREGTKAHED